MDRIHRGAPVQHPSKLWYDLIMTTQEQKRNEIIEKIAREVLHLKTLDVRNSDSLDFHDIHVSQLRDALKHAFLEGYYAASWESE